MGDAVSSANVILQPLLPLSSDIHCCHCVQTDPINWVDQRTCKVDMDTQGPLPTADLGDAAALTRHEDGAGSVASTSPDETHTHTGPDLPTPSPLDAPNHKVTVATPVQIRSNFITPARSMHEPSPLLLDQRQRSHVLPQVPSCGSIGSPDQAGPSRPHPRAREVISVRFCSPLCFQCGPVCLHMRHAPCGHAGNILLHATAHNPAARAVVDHAFPVGGSCTDISTAYTLALSLRLGMWPQCVYVTAAVPL